MLEARKQAVTGLVPPQLGESLIREVWPSVAQYHGPARLGRQLTRSIAGAPLAWLLLAPFYFSKIMPFLAKRYTLTNRRLMIRRGLLPKSTHEVCLAAIDDVRVRKDGNSAFFRSGDLDVVSNGKTILTLAGVPEPESFRHNVMDARNAWAPGKKIGPFVPAKAAAPA
jgi:hypothetical protein